MLTALDLSKYIVSKCANDGHPISNLQLQKILYYIQKDYLLSGSQAFSDDIEAWQFGPVVPNVYYYYSGFGAMPISLVTSNSHSFASEDMSRIDSIVIAKRDLNPWDMVSETHKSGGAWDDVYNNGQGYRGIISPELIKKKG